MKNEDTPTRRPKRGLGSGRGSLPIGDRPRAKISASVDAGLLEWADAHFGDGKRSHALNLGLQLLKDLVEAADDGDVVEVEVVG